LTHGIFGRLFMYDRGPVEVRISSSGVRSTVIHLHLGLRVGLSATHCHSRIHSRGTTLDRWCASCLPFEQAWS